MERKRNRGTSSAGGRKGRARALLTAVVLAMSLAALALAACAPAQNADLDAGGYTPIADTGEDFVTVKAKDYTEPDAGAFTDTWYNREVLRAGNRGCDACHNDMYTSIKGLTVGGETTDVVMEHPIQEPGYGKNYGWRDCTACHMTVVPNEANGLSEGAEIIHSIHFGSKEFTENGNCLSCHAYDFDGKLVLWDDYKYSAEVAGTDMDASNWAEMVDKLNKRGSKSESLADMTIDSEFALDSVTLDQRLSTNPDGSEFMFGAVNLGPPEIDVQNYTLTVSGVKGKSTWTYDEIKALPKSTMLYTQDCVGNIQNGTLISNAEASGVLLSDFIEACGGLEDGMKSFTVKTTDGWKCWGEVFGVELYTEQGAMLCYELNGHELTAKQGYPVALYTPGIAGVFSPKHVETLEFSSDEPTLKNLWPEDGTCEDGWMQTGWLTPATDGQEAKVGEPITLSGWSYEYNLQGHEVDKIALSADYGQNWFEIDVREKLPDYDNGAWVVFEGTWTPQKPGTYVLHAKTVDNKDPDMVPHDSTGLKWDNYASVIIKVSE